MGWDAMILVFWMLSFKSTSLISSFTFIKRLFSSSLLSSIRVVSSAYLRLLIFLLASLIPACASSSPAFHMMCSAYKLNKQGDNIQPWCTPFPIWNQSVVPCPVLPVASWPAYKFLKRQTRWSGIPISFIIFHSLLWSALLHPTTFLIEWINYSDPYISRSLYLHPCNQKKSILTPCRIHSSCFNPFFAAFYKHT